MNKVLDKSKMLQLMVDELHENIKSRELVKPRTNTYGNAASTASKHQILADIRKCRRILAELYREIEVQLP